MTDMFVLRNERGTQEVQTRYPIKSTGEVISVRSNGESKFRAEKNSANAFELYYDNLNNIVGLRLISDGQTIDLAEWNATTGGGGIIDKDIFVNTISSFDTGTIEMLNNVILAGNNISNVGSVNLNGQIFIRNSTQIPDPNCQLHIANTVNSCVWLEADTNNAGETDFAFLRMTEDGNSTQHLISGGDNELVITSGSTSGVQGIRFRMADVVDSGQGVPPLYTNIQTIMLLTKTVAQLQKSLNMSNNNIFGVQTLTGSSVLTNSIGGNITPGTIQSFSDIDFQLFRGITNSSYVNTNNLNTNAPQRYIDSNSSFCPRQLELQNAQSVGLFDSPAAIGSIYIKNTIDKGLYYFYGPPDSRECLLSWGQDLRNEYVAGPISTTSTTFVAIGSGLNYTILPVGTYMVKWNGEYANTNSNNGTLFNMRQNSTDLAIFTSPSAIANSTFMSFSGYRIINVPTAGANLFQGYYRVIAGTGTVRNVQIAVYRIA
jgi:hypothetical protein